MTPCVTYTRVSSEEQAKVGYSIPFQCARLEQEARERDFDVVARFEDVHSAKETGRPGFAVMLRFLEEHPEVRTILVHRMDRLIRNHYEYGLVVEQLGLRIRSVVEPAEDSAAGRMLHGMNVVVAKYHSDNLSSEVKKGLRGCFEEGRCVTRAPVGYRNVSRTRTEKSKVVVDPELAPVVQRMFELYATGEYSLAGLADELFDLGLRTRSGLPYPKDRISRLLRHRFYKGLASYRGETGPGVHDPIVSEALWDAVQQVLERRGRDHGEKGTKFFLLRGLLWCACGRRMTGEDHPKGSYYRCMPDTRRERCPSRYVPVRQIDEQVELLLPKVALSPDGKCEVTEALHRLAEEQGATREREEASLRAKVEQLQGKLVKLTDHYAGGDIPADAYRRLRTGYEHELVTLGMRLDALTSDLSHDIAAIERILDMATAVSRIYALAHHPEDRKALLRQVFSRIVVKDRTITDIEYNPPFDLLLGETRATGSGIPLERALLEHIATRKAA